jgi:hypothetical protein
MSKARFSDMNSIDSVLADHVIQAVRRGDPERYQQVQRQVRGRTLSLDNGLGQKLDEFFDEKEHQQDLQHWSKEMDKRVNGDKFLKEHSQKQSAELQKAIDLRQAELRIEYWQSKGLEDTPSNKQVFVDWLESHANAYASAPNIDAIVKTEGPRGTNRLTWIQTAPVEATPKPQPTIWSPDSGEPLPDNATKEMLHRATLAQVKEWAKRKQNK